MRSDASTDEPTNSVEHSRVADAFVQQIRDADVAGVERLFLFGSTARGDATGLDSDVDFLAVVADDADRQRVADHLRDVAYDVMLDYGPVVEVHVVSESRFEAQRERGHPFIRAVVREGRSYA